jgi:tetratricopeptide (TPR) repeat protein
MTKKRTIVLDRIRTDGWFERLGESIGSFDTLCEVLGERFFAFSLIAQARVSSLMIDRFNPDNSLVEFCFSGIGDPDDEEPERLSVVEFRRRVVERLLADEAPGPVLADLTSEDPDGLQRHIGARLLLLAPVFGFGVRELVLEGTQSSLRVDLEGDETVIALGEFRRILHNRVRDELERGAGRSGNSGTAIDLNHVAEAEKAAQENRWDKVVQLLGSWPMPLAVYWRTPEGQMLPDAARQRIAEGLGLLGTACGKLGDAAQGEEVMRLAVQYAQEGAAGARIFARLGRILMDSSRYGEAIASLRRASMLAPEESGEKHGVLLDLARCFQARGAKVAALASLMAARKAGSTLAEVAEVQRWLDAELGVPLDKWRALTASK